MTSEEKKKLPVRIVSLILAVLMVIGMAYYTIYILISAINASDADNSNEEIEVINTSSLKDSGDVMISVGLMYGSNLTTGFQTTTPEGYTVGIQDLYGNRDFDEIWDIDDNVISCTSDANLSKTGLTFLIAESRRDAVVGGYHIQIDCDHIDRKQVEDLIGNTEEDVDSLGLYIIPSYIYTGYALRIGDFVSESDAEEYIEDIRDIYDGEIVSIVSPSRTAVSVIDPYNDVILFEFDCGGEYELGLAAHEDQNGNTYITTPAGNNYDGIFCFKRYDNGETDGVSLINILPLEAYIAGVLPYEVSNTWPLETLKAFAIAVRSYTLTHLEKHIDTYGFDLCNTTNCQVYKGAGRINERVMDAVLETEGMVMTYDNEIVTAYYSSSMGGVTVSAFDAWGGKDVPYLQAVETPWENYMVHNNAFWITEISPEALLERLHTAGYDELKDAIEEVEIAELAENSTYVKTLRVTDIHGTSIEITNTDNVRTSLTPYVNSANFVVGRGQVEYTEDIIIDYVEDYEDDYMIGSGNYDIDSGYMTLDDCYVITEDSLEKNYSDNYVKILTGDSEIEHEKNDVFVITRQNAAAFLGDEYNNYVFTEEEDAEIKYNTSIIEEKSTDEILYKVAYAEDEDNFIFVGKGWGHGVGMSQYGARDMAGFGYSAEEILMAYFLDTQIVHYEDTDDFN